ncbi:MAG: hypothetical protein ABI456_08850 [Ktedonobacteraceae bacterium]
MQHEIESLLPGELGEGEQVLWSGRPKPGARSRNSPGTVLLILALVYGLLGIAMLVLGFILSSALPDRASPASLVPYIMAAVFLFLTVLFVILGLILRQSLKGTLYAVTDQRIIVMNTGRTLTVDSYGRDDIGQIRRSERPDGSGDLTFASTNTRMSYGYGYNSAYGNNAYGANTASMGKFVGIPDVRAAERVVRRTFK